MKQNLHWRIKNNMKKYPCDGIVKFIKVKKKRKFNNECKKETTSKNTFTVLSVADAGKRKKCDVYDYITNFKENTTDFKIS